MSISNSTIEGTMKYPARARKRPPTHPGKVVADLLGALRVSTRLAAREISVTPAALGNIITGKSGVTPEMALRLGKLFGNGPELWLGMQQDFDLWRARNAMQSALAQIKPIANAA
jgi:antitoxin HigA-1